MSLVSYDLFGNEWDKEAKAIEIARSFEPPEGYYLAYSGGKDSIVVKAILDLAGVKYDAHYNVTTVDPPELVRFVIQQFEAVIYELPDGSRKFFEVKPVGTKLLQRTTPEQLLGKRTIYFSIPRVPMRKLIVEKLFPPTQIMRYCCEQLKEVNGDGRKVVTGVRWAESQKRKKNQGVAVVWSSKEVDPRTVADSFGATYKENERKSVILNYDDAAARRTVEFCYRTNKTLINPIIDFGEDDVWEFIKKHDLPYCSLYDEGFTRLGCVGCPMARRRGMAQAFKRWPHMKKLYIRAFDEMLKERQRRGKNKTQWKTGEEVFEWWTTVSDTPAKPSPDQIRIDDLFGEEEKIK